MGKIPFGVQGIIDELRRQLTFKKPKKMGKRG